jgi:hypothetical protein
MGRKYAIALALGALVLIVVVVILATRSSTLSNLSTNIQRGIGGQTVTVTSNVQGTKTEWVNKQAFDDIVERLRIYELGIRDLSSSETVEVSDIEIIYTDVEQPLLTFVTPEGSVVSGVSYEVINRVLTMRVYSNRALAPNGDAELALNKQLIFTLVALSLTSPNRSVTSGEPTTTTIDERMEYFTDILQEYFGAYDSEIPYPIKLI